MKFSVIIPVYNSEKYINNCINSIINQKYKNFEIIIVDDGSTDCTEDIINSIITNNPKVNIFYTKIRNSGPGTARNIGIKKATGDYVCFLDSDDKYNENLFLELNNILNDEDICFFGWEEIDYLTNKTISLYSDKFSFLDKVTLGKEVLKLKFNAKLWLCNCNEVYRLNFLKDNNILYPEGVYYGEDTNFIYKSLAMAQKVSSLNMNYFINIYRQNSLMHSNYSDKNATQIKSLNDLIDFANYNKMDDDIINIFESIRYYSLIEGTKKIARSVGFFSLFKYNKMRKKYIPKLKYNKKYIYSKMHLREVKIFNFSKILYFFVVKLFDLRNKNEN